MSHTEKYNVATFIEKMVFAKSYSAQLARSMRGARTGNAPAVRMGAERSNSMRIISLIDGRDSTTKLPTMPLVRRFSRHFRAPLICAALAVASSCERSKPPARVDTTTVSTATPSIPGAQPTVGSSWVAQLGPMLLFEGSAPDEAIVIAASPDSGTSAARAAAGAGSEIALFGRGGSQLSAHFGAAASSEESECTVWPLRDLHGEGPSRGWSIGFISHEVKPVALDSVDILTPRDSMTCGSISWRGLATRLRRDGAFRYPPFLGCE